MGLSGLLGGKKNDSAEKNAGESKVGEAIIKVEILLPVAGKFKLSANVGEEVPYLENIANTLIEAKYAKKVK